MSRKHFSVLALALIAVVVAIALLVPRPTDHTASPPEETLLLPGVGDHINDATRLVVTLAGGQTVATLERGEKQWTVAELHGYPADWSKLQPVLAGLAQAKIVETKTANPDYYGRLGIQDLDAADAPGMLLTVTVDGKDYGVILGNVAEHRSGRYARLAGSGPGLLVDFDAEVPRQAVGWVNSEVADVPTDDVAEVVIEHPGGEKVRVSKVSANDTDFALDGIPKGREVTSKWTVNSLGGLLASLHFEDVRPDAEFDWSKALTVEMVRFNGVRLKLQAVESDGAHWVRLSATPPPPEPQAEPEAAPEAAAEAAAEPAGSAAEAAAKADTQSAEAGSTAEAAGSESTPAASEPVTPDPAAEVQALNERVAGWAYKIADYKYTSMDKHLEDLLKQPEKDEDKAKAAKS